MVAATVSVFRKCDSAHILRRRVSDETVKNAATILVMYITVFVFGAMVISSIESLPLTDCLNETASAIGTVGLTTGITPSLSAVSRIVLIILMYMG